MKKLNLLSVITFLICSFSLTVVTAQVKVNDSVAAPEPSKVVILDSIPAKMAIAEIIAGEACAKELKVTNFVLKVTEKKSQIQERMISNLKEQSVKLEEQKQLQTEQLTSKDNIIRATEKQLSRQETISWVWKAIATVGVLSTGYLLITN